MTEETIFFQSPRFLSELYCGKESNLAKAEKALQAQIVSRDDWLKISGENGVVGRAKTFFQLLEKAKRQGMRITNSDFSNMLELVEADGLDEMKELFDNPIKIELRAKSVVPKSLNQKRYLQSIEQRDVVFGIGPAGTGKTYLAVAAALRALMEEKVERGILTRPAVVAREAPGFLPGRLSEKIQPHLPRL
ncbi:MAG: PhoH family protein, partial [Puniceicoccaceae bacterium]